MRRFLNALRARLGLPHLPYPHLVGVYHGEAEEFQTPYVREQLARCKALIDAAPTHAVVYLEAPKNLRQCLHDTLTVLPQDASTQRLFVKDFHRLLGVMEDNAHRVDFFQNLRQHAEARGLQVVGLISPRMQRVLLRAERKVLENPESDYWFWQFRYANLTLQNREFQRSLASIHLSPNDLIIAGSLHLPFLSSLFPHSRVTNLHAATAEQAALVRGGLAVFDRERKYRRVVRRKSR